MGASGRVKGSGMIAVRQLLKRKKYLTFALGDGEYGFDVVEVEGIIPLQPMDPVLNAPRYCRGVATVQGRVVIIVDTRMKLGMPEGNDTVWTSIILTTLDENVHIGWVVDRVREVIDIDVADIEPPPPAPGEGRGEVLGMVKRGMRITTLLAAEELLGPPPIIINH